jgi:signal peptidase II
MQRVKLLPGKWRHVVFFLSSLLIVTADQLSKSWIRNTIPEGQSLFRLGFFQITNIRNTGAAFGLFRDQTFALAIIATVAAAVILVYAFISFRHFPWLDTGWSRTSLGLILGGAAGNLIDRLRFGYVTDFIDFGYWPAFNVADSAVTVGTIMLVIVLLRTAQTEKRQDGDEISSGGG